MGTRGQSADASGSSNPSRFRAGPVSVLQIVIGSVLGTGYIPVAPATFSSLLALALIWALPRSVIVYGVVVLAVFILAVWLATVLERRWGHDARHITIDELVGMLVSFFLVPFTFWSALTGFLLFRFFDILKLPFVRSAEKLPRGWGVVLDDVLAGVCANIVLQVLFRMVFRVEARPWLLLS